MASMTYRELRKLLEAHGCAYVRDARHGGHEIWRCPGRKQFSVPKKLKGEGTLQTIIKEAGLKSGEDAGEETSPAPTSPP